MVILYFIFVMLPAIFWFAFFRWEDRCDPGSRKFMLKIFLLGIGMAALASGIEMNLSLYLSPNNPNLLADSLQSGYVTVYAIIGLILASTVEELVKFFVFKAFVFKNIQLNQVADGIFYAVTLALGFAVIENTGYFLVLSRILSPELYLTALTLRATFSVLLHLTTAGIMGYFFGRYKFGLASASKLYLSLIWAIVLHITFNLFGQISLIILLPSFIFLLTRFRKPENIKIWGVKSESS